MFVQQGEALAERHLHGEIEPRRRIVEHIGFQSENSPLVVFGLREGRCDGRKHRFNRVEFDRERLVERDFAERHRLQLLRLHGFLGLNPNAYPCGQTQFGHVVADNILICIAVVELLQTPFLRVVSDRSIENFQHPFAVGTMIVGFDFLAQTRPVLRHRTQADGRGVELALLGNVGENEPASRFRTFAREPDVAFVDSLRRSVGIDGDTVDARRVRQIIPDMLDLGTVVEIIFVDVDSVAPVIKSETLCYGSSIGAKSPPDIPATF